MKYSKMDKVKMYETLKQEAERWWLLLPRSERKKLRKGARMTTEMLIPLYVYHESDVVC